MPVANKKPSYTALRKRLRAAEAHVERLTLAAEKDIDALSDLESSNREWHDNSSQLSEQLQCAKSELRTKDDELLAARAKLTEQTDALSTAALRERQLTEAVNTPRDEDTRHIRVLTASLNAARLPRCWWCKLKAWADWFKAVEEPGARE